MLSADLSDPSKCWPILRSQLEQWTNWFRYRRTAGSAPQGFDLPRQPLILSPAFERSLAANLPRELFRRFQPELVDGHHRDAFNQSLLRILDGLGEELRPLDPLRHIREFPEPGEANTALKLLDAEYRAVPYVGRRDDLDALWRWLEDPAPVSCQVVVGRGGNGKTRLAFRLLEEIEERQPFRWHAGLLPHERFEDELRNEKFRRWRLRKPTLIVIDYADASAPLLGKFIIPELARNRLGENDPPVRLLLLARTADATQGWYKTLRRAAGSREDDLFPKQPLELSELNAGQRRHLVAGMLGAATRAKDEPKARLFLPPEGSDPVLDARLRDPEFADPLVLGMAAIVAHGEQSLRAMHLHRTDLARGIAVHERRRLEKLAANGDTDFLVHMAAYVNLSGSMTFDELEQAATTEKSDLETLWKPGEVATILAPRGMAGPIPLDIIAEAFVHDVLREQAQHGPAAVMRAASSRPGAVTRFLVRTVQDYAPDPARPSSHDEQCQKWALIQLTALLTRHAEAITDDVFWQIHGALPLDTVAMIGPARNFYRSVCRVKQSTSPAGLAALVSYATYESRAGNRTAALAAILRAVENCRELVGKNREAFLPDLAAALNNQANRQSEMGQRAEALPSIQEAVEHYRELVGKNREAFLPGLAMALNNQANLQSEMGQRAEALESIQEAVGNYRELVGKNREAFLPGLARALNNQANRQSEMGQRAEALESIQEAVKIRRELVGKNREAFLPDLAGALNNQANLQSAMGQRAEALESIQEAVKIRRELVGKNREAFLPNLAMALNNQAIRQSEMGQRAEALPSVQEAVERYRELVGKHREAFLPDLAMALNNQANLQSEMGQRAEALPSIQEAVEHYRELVGKNREAFLPDLAAALNNQANLQSDVGQRAEALESIQEAVENYRELVGKNREAFLPNLAMALNNQANRQSEMGQRAEALQSIQEALENYREVVGKNREAFLPNLAAALNNRANLQSEMGQRAEALESIQEALESIQEAIENYRELVRKNREAFLPDLAMALNNQANRQSDMGQRAEALECSNPSKRLSRITGSWCGRIGKPSCPTWQRR
ncbi:putative TPR repeat-containing protein [Candidatus Sulfopaludibacter sp. SbA4]|nr:putative TPR repeat-containing protein [Candidatus Sulfopaludibacter sp. SbA4]